MAIDIEIIQHQDYFEFIVTGTHELNEAIVKFSYVLNACKNTGVTKVLIDYSDLIYQGEATEKTLYAVGVEDQYLKYINSGGLPLQIAYLCPQIAGYEPGVQIGKKIESLHVELFDKRKKALEWLKGKTT